MIYYPVVGDICRYEMEEEKANYLIMDVTESAYRQVHVYLLRLDNGEHFPDYIWPIGNLYWHKVA